MSDATKPTFSFETGNKEFINPLTNEKQVVTYRYAVANTTEEAEALAGSVERICALVTSANKNRIQSKFSTTALKSIKTAEDLEKHIADALSDLEDTNAPLASTRGTGVNAKAKAFDDLQARLAAATTDEERLAVIKQMGY